MEFSLDDRGGWTHIEAVGDDLCHYNIPLGFLFTGFGASTTSVSVSSNGILFFGQECSTALVNSVLPTAISTAPFLAFFWDDLTDYGTGEFMEYATFGSAGGRVCNLYAQTRLFSTACGTDGQSMMISVHEGSNLVKVAYLGFTGCAQLRGSSATLGFQAAGGAGAQAVLVGYDDPVLDDNTPSQSMSFQPPPP